MHSYGVTSMTAPLRRVLVRRPATAGDWAGAAWRTPDPDLLLRQHEAFCALLAGLGAEVETAQALDGQVDAVYVHDPLVMTARGGIPLRMAKPARRAEPRHAAEELERLGIPVIGTLEPPAYADGGDRFWLDDRTVALGIGYRTNRAGAAALARLLEAQGVTVEPYDMPHDQGPGAVLHLQSFLSAVTDDLYVVYEPLAAVRLLQDLRNRGVEWIAIDHDSYLAMGAATCCPSGRAWSSCATAPRRSAARWSAAASRCTPTTARSSPSRAMAARPASPRRCCAGDRPRRGAAAAGGVGAAARRTSTTGSRRRRRSRPPPRRWSPPRAR
jgi:N-dimethylarginine dimethylaminohydrolase